MRDIIYIMNTRDELLQLKENIGISWMKLSEYFGIPYRTIQDCSSFSSGLHSGEIEVILLAQETEADLLILDDNAAKKAVDNFRFTAEKQNTIY